jgi:hypothetical protein
MKDTKLFGKSYKKFERTVEILGGRTTDFSWTVGSSRLTEGLRRESLNTCNLSER